MEPDRAPKLLVHPRFSERLLYYEGTRTLVNKLDLRDPGALARAERSAMLKGLADLRGHPVEPTFDIAHLKAIHLRLFESIYAFAGEFTPRQTLKLNLTTQVSGRSLPVQHEVNALLREVRDSVLESGNKNQFILGIADAFTTLELWRPFIRGNGVTGRVYVAQLAHAAGYDCDFSRDDPILVQDAQARAVHGVDSVELLRLINQTARPLYAVAFETAMRTGDRAAVVRKFPQLQPVFQAIEDARDKLEHQAQGGRRPSERHFDRLVHAAQRVLNDGREPERGWAEEIHRLLSKQRGLDR